MSEKAINLSIPKARTKRHGNLNGPLCERGWLQPAENLSALPCNRDLSTDTITSQTHLARQSL
jgi:hypothetical protein